MVAGKAASAAWRQAGLSYLQYLGIASRAVRSALKVSENAGSLPRPGPASRVRPRCRAAAGARPSVLRARLSVRLESRSKSPAHPLFLPLSHPTPPHFTNPPLPLSPTQQEPAKSKAAAREGLFYNKVIGQGDKAPVSSLLPKA